MKAKAKQLRQLPGRKAKLLCPHHGACRLREVRERFRIPLTRRDVALSIGMSAARYGELENGASVRLDMARKIAAVLESTVDAIWSAGPVGDP